MQFSCLKSHELKQQPCAHIGRIVVSVICLQAIYFLAMFFRDSPGNRVITKYLVPL